MSRGRGVFPMLLAVLVVGAYYLDGFSQEYAAQKVHRYCYEVNSKEWYQAQEELWRSELRVNPQNQEAWHNYFLAARYGWAEVKGRTYTREALMDSIYTEMGKAVPDSWVCHYLHYYSYGTDFSRLERAYELAPGEPDLYWEFIKYHELTGDYDSRREFSQKLYESEDIATGILELDYNILSSTEPKSVLFTNGDNDTYPTWMIQDTRAIRPDVLVLNVHSLFGNRAYLERRLEERGAGIDTTGLSNSDVAEFLEQLIVRLNQTHPEVPLHIARTVYGGYYAGIANNLHETGMVYTYVTGPIDAAAIHRRLLEQELRLDYLNIDWYGDQHVSSALVTRLNLIYVQPFLHLAEQHSAAGDDDSSRMWKTRALSLARVARHEALVEEIETSLR